jgi:membrane protein YdbS with pleckstrin-like domain
VGTKRKGKQVSGSNPSIRKLLVSLVLLLVLVSRVACLIVAEAFHPPQPWKWLLAAIGGFLAISVAASFVYSATLRRLDDAERKDELRRLALRTPLKASEPSVTDVWQDKRALS